MASLLSCVQRTSVLREGAPRVHTLSRRQFVLRSAQIGVGLPSLAATAGCELPLLRRKPALWPRPTVLVLVPFPEYAPGADAGALALERALPAIQEAAGARGS